MHRIALFLIALTAWSVAVHADSFVLSSGNEAAVGQRDSRVSVVGSEVTVAGVTYESSGVPLQQALVLVPHQDWTATAGAAWVGIADGTSGSPVGGYVYRTSFDLPQGFTTPSLFLRMTSDNASMTYLNGHLVASVINQYAEFGQTFDFFTGDAGEFVEGANSLEFHVVNTGKLTFINPSGLWFRAEVTYTPVPEPSTLLALFAGIGGLGGLVGFERRGRSGSGESRLGRKKR